jgi:hypothetical protein
MTSIFVEEDPIRTRERIIELLESIKGARGSSLGINQELAHKVLVERGLSYEPSVEYSVEPSIDLTGKRVEKKTERKTNMYALRERGRTILSVELSSTSYLDGYDEKGNKVRGEPFVQLVYRASASTGYINLDGIERWILKLKGEKDDANPLPVRAQNGAA